MCKVHVCVECVRGYLTTTIINPTCFTLNCSFRFTTSAILQRFGMQWYSTTYIPHVYDEVFKEQMALKEETLDTIQQLKEATPIEAMNIMKTLVHSTPTWIEMGNIADRFKGCYELIGLITHRVSDDIREKVERLCAYACSFHYNRSVRMWKEKHEEMRDLRLAYFSGRISTDCWIQEMMQCAIEIRVLETRITQLQILSEKVYENIQDTIREIYDSELNRDDENDDELSVLIDRLKKLMNALVCDVVSILFESAEEHRKTFNDTCLFEGYGFTRHIKLIDDNWS